MSHRCRQHINQLLFAEMDLVVFRIKLVGYLSRKMGLGPEIIQEFERREQATVEDIMKRGGLKPQ